MYDSTASASFRLPNKTRKRLTAAVRRAPKPSKLADHNPPQATAEEPEAEPRRVSIEPVSYTHLTLPTNREV